MIGLGVSSFSHFGGVNFQNAHNFEEYVRILNDGSSAAFARGVVDAEAAADSRDGPATENRLARYWLFSAEVRR